MAKKTILKNKTGQFIYPVTKIENVIGAPFMINFTKGKEQYGYITLSPDKSYAEILAAIVANKIIQGNVTIDENKYIFTTDQIIASEDELTIDIRMTACISEDEYDLSRKTLIINIDTNDLTSSYSRLYTFWIQTTLEPSDGIEITGNAIYVDTSFVQEKLTAGDNITIDEDNVISATDTTYSTATTSADGLMSSTDKTKLDGISEGPAFGTDTTKFLRNDQTWAIPASIEHKNVSGTSLGELKFARCTQAEYDALTTPDATTFYIIIG